MKTVHKTHKKLLAIFMLFAFLCQSEPAFASGLTKAEDIAGSQQSNIYYGSYWQNAVSGYTPTGTSSSPETFNTNNYTKTAVKYRVLDNNSGTGQILVLSDQGLYADQFNSIASKGDTWATSEIRGTLNKTAATTFDASGNASSWGGFAGDAFSAKELAAIADTTHTGGGSYANSSCQSTDKIFLLAAGEAQAYGFAAGDDRTITRQMTATEMARHAAMYENSGAANVYTIGTSNWWLRSPGNSSSVSSFAYEIPRHGYVSSTGHVTYGSSAARAAFNLNSDSILFASAAEGGKSDVAKGSGFALEDYTGSDYKLTLYDETIATPSDLAVSQEHTGHATVAELAKDTAAGGTLDLTNGLTSTYGANVNVSFNSSAITDKTANYVSAVVKDKDGNLVNYAKVSNAATGTDVSVGTGSLANGSYEMYLFAEQANGEYETDYASSLSKGYTIHKGDVTTNEGTLTADYKNSSYTAALGNGFNLSFEGAQYDTAVTTAATGASLFGAGSTIKSLAVGGNTNVSGSMNIATLTRTDGTVTVNGTLTSDTMNATGNNNKLNATGTTVYGANNTVSGDNSAAFGNNNTISGQNSFVFGNNATTTANNAVLIGVGTNATAESAVAIGQGSSVAAAATNSVALGAGSVANGANEVSVGNSTLKRKITNVAAGEVSATSMDAINGSQLYAAVQEIGGAISGGDKPEGAKDAEAKGEGAVAIGYNSVAEGAESVATGYNAAVSKKSSSGIAIGNGTTVGYSDGTTIGEDTAAVNSIGIGYNTTVTGSNSVAVGTGHIVTGNNSGAFGDPNIVTGSGSYAIGNDNTITGDNTFVLGNNVKTSAKNAVVLGNNSTATRDNTVSVGAPGAERQITNVAAGTMGTDAANMNQLWGVEKESREIAAMSGALAGLHYLEPSGEGDDRVTGAVAYGGYRGQNAAAVGLAYKPSPNVMLSASTSVGNSQNIYNAGVSVKFGKGKTVNRAEMAKQIKYLGEENDKLKSTVEAQGKENAELKNTVAQQGEQLQQQGAQIQELLKAVKNMQKKPAAAKDGSKKARGKRY